MYVLFIPPSSEFLDFVESFNLQQSVKNPTHWKGHILDLLLSSGFWNVELVDVFVSDQNAVILKAPLPSSSPLKPHPITLSHIFTADSASKFSNCFILVTTTLPQNLDELLTSFKRHWFFFHFRSHCCNQNQFNNNNNMAHWFIFYIDTRLAQSHLFLGRRPQHSASILSLVSDAMA